MLSEPFNTDLDCLLEVTRFLLRHHDPVHHLWTESIEDLWSPHRVYSLWATADIMSSLLDVADYIDTRVATNAPATKSQLDTLKAQILRVVDAAAESLVKVNVHIQRYAESQKKRDIDLLMGKGGISSCHQLLTEIVRETMGYYGWPRSFSPQPSSAHGHWGTTNLIASCYAYIALRRRADMASKGVSHSPASINIWLRQYSDQLVRPELGLLRRSLRLLDDEFLTRPSVSREQLTDDYLEYWDTLKITYERLVSSIPHSFAAVLDRFPGTFPVHLDGVVSVLANLVPSNLDHGVMWIDESGYGGWLSSPFHTGSGIDPVATLSALEVIAGSPNVNELTDKATARLLHAFDFGLASLENTVASASTDTTTWMTALHKDKELSERWPLGLMCRFVMAFYFIEQHLARENALAQLDQTQADIFRDRARVLMAIMYTALIVKGVQNSG